MTNTQLKAFLSLCQVGSLSAAAEQLYISQPAVSRLIQSLEQELGYRLFKRGKGQHGIFLTPEGESFYSIAREMEQLYARAITPTEIPIHENLRIGAPPALYTSILPDAYSRFHQRHADIDVTLDSLHSTESFRQLLQGKLDLALINVHMVDTACRIQPLFKESVVLICSRNYLPAGPIHPSGLHRDDAVLTEWSPDFQSWFEYWFGKTFSSSALRLKMGSTIMYFQQLQNFWAIVPETSAYYMQKYMNFDIHYILDPPPDRVCYAAIHQSDGRQALIQPMIDALLECAGEIPALKLL